MIENSSGTSLALERFWRIRVVMWNGRVVVYRRDAYEMAKRRCLESKPP